VSDHLADNRQFQLVNAIVKSTFRQT